MKQQLVKKRVSVVVFFAMTLFFASKALQPRQMSEVLVATKLLAPMQMLKDSNITHLKVDERLIPGGAIFADDKKTILGKRVVRLVGEAEMITWSALEGAYTKGSYRIPENMRLVVFKPRNLEQMRRSLTLEDSVDILWHPHKNGELKKTHILIQNVKIHAIGGKEATAAGSIHVILPIKQAMLLNHAEQMGSTSILLRNPEDSANLDGMRVDTRALLKKIQKPHRNDEIEMIY